MKSKANLILAICVVFLFLILGFEIYYLFFYEHTPTNYQVNENKATQTTGGLNGLWVATTKEKADMMFKVITNRADAIKPLYQSGVLKGYNVTETYKTVIIDIGPRNTTLNPAVGDGKKVRVAYEIKFSTQAQTGNKEISILLSEKELTRTHAYKAFGDDRIPIKLKDIKVGDFVSISVSSDYFADPEEGFSLIEIEKLL